MSLSTAIVPYKPQGAEFVRKQGKRAERLIERERAASRKLELNARLEELIRSWKKELLVALELKTGKGMEKWDHDECVRSQDIMCSEIEIRLADLRAGKRDQRWREGIRDEPVGRVRDVAAARFVLCNRQQPESPARYNSVVPTQFPSVEADLFIHNNYLVFNLLNGRVERACGAWVQYTVQSHVSEVMQLTSDNGQIAAIVAEYNLIQNFRWGGKNIQGRSCFDFGDCVPFCRFYLEGPHEVDDLVTLFDFGYAAETRFGGLPDEVHRYFKKVRKYWRLQVESDGHFLKPRKQIPAAINDIAKRLVAMEEELLSTQFVSNPFDRTGPRVPIQVVEELQTRQERERA